MSEIQTALFSEFTSAVYVIAPSGKYKPRKYNQHLIPSGISIMKIYLKSSVGMDRPYHTILFTCNYEKQFQKTTFITMFENNCLEISTSSMFW